ncbi:M91 family zinc metallopeptidase [Lysobacter sp. GX 14042]|uniref:M91 family zinc metallopeptidase n=1 Tax=Lysobacter sp. GX 14042 TaxID=2907155 RepID=UPI001F35B198|nr:M91 family zinc metallopeptidase [Lysobacter sp. GX 14042]MCE7033527.1 M91 family zinc metallopeptidase [Lysobacter sp. GX 14042]
MSLNLDAASAQSLAQQDIQTYWDNPAAPDTGHAPGLTGPAPVEGPPAQLGEAVRIEGGSNGTRLESSATPDGKEIVRGELHQGEEATVTREQTIVDYGFGQTYVSSDQVVFSTGKGNDNIQIDQRDDGVLDILVNGESYEVKLAQGQELTLRTGAGDDVIEATPNVTVNMVVDAGEGNDRITTGMGDDRVDGGAGDDYIASAGGRNDLFGNSGNDEIHGGEGVNIIHGGDGDDALYAGSGVNFIEGGAGDDRIQGAGGEDIISGGLGDDVITLAGGRNHVYTGQGADSVEGAGSEDTVYAQASDLINSQAGGLRPTVINVEIDANVGHSVTVEGSDGFRQRVEAEMEFLKASPNGQQMLAEFDQAAEAKGNTVTIKELANEENGYAQTFSNDADIVDGRAGAGGNVDISYNPSFHMDAFPAPVVVLYHEMSHAYNGVNGTFLPGTYRGEGPDSGQVPNAERQAVGLETSAEPFDFDGDPSTPATTHNPIHLTENGIRRELGLPDRPSYAL